MVQKRKSESSEFIEECFAALGTTEQGESGTRFRVDYLKPSGAIGFYHPDWAVVQKTDVGEVNWIIETKGRVWDGTAAKDEAIRDWCARISDETGKAWRFMRVNQHEFESCPALVCQTSGVRQSSVRMR